MSVLRDDFQTRTKEMLDQIAELNKKLEDIEVEDSYGDEDDSVADSEYQDKLDLEEENGGGFAQPAKESAKDEEDFDEVEKKQNRSEASKGGHGGDSESDSADDESNPNR